MLGLPLLEQLRRGITLSTLNAISLAILLAAALIASAFLWPQAERASAGVPTLIGDVNCDRVVNPIDVTFILQLGAGLIAALPCPQNGDTNGDGVTNPLDAALILQFSAGIISSLGPPLGPTSTPTNTPSHTPTNPPTAIATSPPAPTSTPILPSTATSTFTPPRTPTRTATPLPTLQPAAETTLLAADGQYLGLVTCNTFAADGIFNRFGTYGSRFSSTSIWNMFGQYGGQSGSYSPFNRFAVPPSIFTDGVFSAYLTMDALGYLPRITPVELVFLCFPNNSSELNFWLDLIAQSS